MVSEYQFFFENHNKYFDILRYIVLQGFYLIFLISVFLYY